MDNENDYFGTFILPATVKLKNSIFELAVIPQTLDIIN